MDTARTEPGGVAREEKMKATLPVLLRRAVEQGGSDLHLTSGTPPRIRVHGELVPQDDLDPLSAADTKRLVYSGLSDAQRRRFEATSELDCAFPVPGVARVRANIFGQRGEVAAVYRLIPDRIRAFETLGLPSVVASLVERPHGLVLVTGPAGCGKSTTLAALVDRVNSRRRGHILTIEDPVEYVHRHRRSVVNQREVGTDTAGFAPALRAALREDPDVVLIGEIRDLETTEAALRIAETGHLTLATLHTGSAVQTITRIVDLFPAHQQPLARTQLAMVLEGVICQRLLPTPDGRGRVCAAEVLIASPAVRNLIRDDRLHQVYSAMQAGQEALGMRTLSQSLAALCARGLVAREQALAHASNREELRALLDRRRAAAAGIGAERARSGSENVLADGDEGAPASRGKPRGRWRPASGRA